MESRTIHDKISDNVRVTKAAADEAMLRAMYRSAARKGTAGDAVAPSVKGLRGVQPSVKGIAAKARDKRFAELARVAKTTADGLAAIKAIKDSAEGLDPALAALVNDPKLFAVIAKVIEKIGDEVMRLTSAASAESASGRGNAGPDFASGDSAFIPLTADDMAMVERAQAKLAQLKTADALGDAGDIARARFGYEPREYDSDDMDNLIDRLSGKTK